MSDPSRRPGGPGARGPVLEGPVRDRVPVDASHVQRARLLATLLDNAVRIPGLGVRVGLDPLLGLIPGVGDFVGAGVSGYIIVLAARAGASPAVLARMVGNVAIDALAGAVPVLGDLADFGWKANAKNVALLEQHVTPDVAAGAAASPRRAGALAVGAALLLLLLLAAGGLVLAIAAARWLVSKLDGSG